MTLARACSLAVISLFAIGCEVDDRYVQQARNRAALSIAGSGAEDAGEPDASDSGLEPPCSGQSCGPVGGADDPATPGDDRPGYFQCGNGSTCGPSQLCCLGLTGCTSLDSYPTCPGRPIDDCDGPEDCGEGERCWVMRFGHFCGPLLGGGYYVACHDDADCSTAPCFQGFPSELCALCAAGSCVSPETAP